MSSRKPARLLRALEQIQSDESLTANLTDSSAETVYRLLETELEAAADLDDDAFAERVATLRRAAKAAARTRGDSPPALLAALEPVLQAGPPVADPRIMPHRVGAARRSGRRRRRRWSQRKSRR